MAIKRPVIGSAGPEESAGGEIATVGDIIDVKKTALATNKKQGSAKPRTNKKSTSADKKSGTDTNVATKKKRSAPKRPGMLLPPKHLKTEDNWRSYLQSISIERVINYLEKKPDKITVTMAIVLRSFANRILRLTDKLPSNYNDWLDFFSTMTPEETESFIEEHTELSNEAKSAGMRWLSIRDNPGLIDKIVNSRLEQRRTEELGNIMAASKSGDRVKLFEAIRDNVAYKIQEGSGARDMTVLIKQLNEVTLTLDELYRARGDKEDGNSSVRKLLLATRKRAQRPKSSQAVATITDMEEGDDED